MSSTMEHLNRCREERMAKEKARIERLRELNLKKYGKTDYQTPKNLFSSSIPVKSKQEPISNTKDTTSIHEKKNLPNTINKRPFSVPTSKVSNKEIVVAKSNKTSSHVNINKSKINSYVKSDLNAKKDTANAKSNIPFKDITRSVIPKPVENLNGKNVTVSAKVEISRKTLDESKSIVKPNIKSKLSEESVFDRLYKPKVISKQSTDNNMKLNSRHSYLKKANKEDKVTNKRHTVFENKPTLPVRRSISAVHFKKINKSELGNCIHKWASVGEKINKAHVKDVNEDDSVKDERIISAVKSEKKKVKFQTPIHLNFNTPKPEELQTRLQKWLQKRGKSIDSYHHLQCFGLHHLTRDIKPLNFVDYDDEDKENIAVEQDIDNASLDEINDEKEISTNKWRRVSSVCDSVDYNDSYESTLNSEGVHHVDELLLGALNDLTDLLREGFDWEQCARWLRAIRDRYPLAPNKAAYWECRAALEERRGDLPASVQCWEQAIAAGTEQSVVEANLDNLLDKFMQLKISPNSGKTQIDSKLVDVKNVFKSTIIRFAVQQAKLRQSTEKPKYTVTPVRRSSRLSTFCRTTPRRVCTTIHQATELGAEFIPNKALLNTP